MPAIRNYLYTVFIASGIFILSLIFYLLLQNRFVYNSLASHVINNYYHENNTILRGKVPYESYAESKMLHWDARLYLQIKENGYDTVSAGGDYIFAFFPLFPIVWRITHMTPSMISIFNYVLFIFAVILIIRHFHSRKMDDHKLYAAAAICSPMLAVFLIPYSEGIFMLTATIALWGIYKDKYLVYFIAAMLMSVTRSSVTILVVALLLTEIYFWFGHRKSLWSLRSFTLKLLPLISGILIVSFIQYLYESQSFFRFLQVQRYWGFQFQIPRHLTDWAHEQFGTNLSLLLLLLPLSTVYAGYHWFRYVFKRSGKPLINALTAEAFRKEYLFVLSLFFMTGMVLSVLLFRGGSLNGLSRYILCTPFYYITLFLMKEKLSDVKTAVKVIFFTSFFIITLTVLSASGYSSSWNFSDTGFLLFYLQLSFFVFSKLSRQKWLVILFAILTALWTSYLFNMFISDTWIFT
ncbi:MAG: hypothetical protein JXA61_03940 [Bacteroidales bacterium]|nr:hypothetical protein [Bacteroidales bacterium]